MAPTKGPRAEGHRLQMVARTAGRLSKCSGLRGPTRRPLLANGTNNSQIQSENGGFRDVAITMLGAECCERVERCVALLSSVGSKLRSHFVRF